MNHIATPELDLRHELGMEEEGKTRTPEERGKEMEREAKGRGRRERQRGKEWRERKKGEVGERERQEREATTSYKVRRRLVRGCQEAESVRVYAKH